MSCLTSEQLLGYLLGALECKECEEVEQALAQSAELRAEFEKIRRSLDTVGLLDQPEYDEVPLCLASRTCEFVESQAEFQAKETFTLKTATQTAISAAYEPTKSSRAKVTLSPVSRSEAGGSSLRKLDLLIACSIVLIAVALSFPALFTSRFQANVNLCHNHLMNIGRGLHSYSELQADGSFPSIEAEGPRSVAGVYAPTLVSNQLVTNVKDFFCPGNTELASAEQVIPTLAELDSAKGPLLAKLQEKMGGGFGYNMGYAHDEDVLPPRNSRRAEYALLADAPSDSQPGRSSSNHAGRGQNMLYEDGSVKFVKLSNVAELATKRSALDDPFHNRLGLVAAGVDVDDAVLGRSPERPMPFQK